MHVDGAGIPLLLCPPPLFIGYIKDPREYHTYSTYLKFLTTNGTNAANRLHSRRTGLANTSLLLCSKSTMPQKRKRDSTTESIPDDEILSHERENAASTLITKGKLKRRTGFDIEQNIRIIRAILATNKEIWDRCKTNLDSVDSDKHRMTLSRHAYEKIETRDIGQELQLITRAELSFESFHCKVLSTLPAGLEILPPHYMEVEVKNEKKTGIFVDFEMVFKSSLVLHDSVLEPFLAKLKTHLEEIQVCLGKIDEWLMLTQYEIEFIETTFGKRLERPGIVAVADCIGKDHKHPFSEKCLRCPYPLGSHSAENYYCPNAPYASYSPRHPVFQCATSATHVLKKCKVNGKFEASFNIAKDDQQEKLRKFLDFVCA
eukprot:scaffold1786_cov138-Cylindrotheca_fusiformis.AAC.4